MMILGNIIKHNIQHIILSHQIQLFSPQLYLVDWLAGWLAGIIIIRSK